jgi:hypothetical protein
LKSKGFALGAVLVIVVLVPIAVFGITFFVTSSITRYEAQTRNMKALYLAEAGIHRAIFNIESTGTPLPVSNWSANNLITVTADVPSVTKWGLTSTGTSVSPAPFFRRVVYAEYDSAINRISAYLEKPVSGAPLFPFTFYGYKWGLDEGLGGTTGTTPVIGTLRGTSPTATLPAWVAGRVRNALSFNQAPATHNFVLVPDNAGLDVISAGSLMAWIRMTALPATGTGIVRRGSETSVSSQEAYGLLIITSGANRRVRFILRSSSGGIQRAATGATNLAINTWYHVAGTWGASGLRVYLNGVQDGVNATVYSSYNTTSPLHIGTLRRNASGTRFFGIIDEVYLHTRQLSAAEILAYYNATKP